MKHEESQASDYSQNGDRDRIGRSLVMLLSHGICREQETYGSFGNASFAKRSPSQKPNDGTSGPCFQRDRAV